MTLTQLKYIVAIDTHRHFAIAAEKCFVSQPTLSMQLQKVEEELGIRIFDRSKQPLVPTDVGSEIIEQSRKIIAEFAKLDEIANLRKGIISGSLTLGIIPTVAPYLLPIFLQKFTRKYPLVKLIINELTTDNILADLRNGKIDVGILATPLGESGIKEYPLFYEKLLVYVSKDNCDPIKNLLPADIDPQRLWLLEEGHCFRGQIEYICELKKASSVHGNVNYESGSIETLRRMVDTNNGITILPELATIDMTAEQFSQIRHFEAPAPMREISIVIHRNYIKKKLIDALRSEIVDAIPEGIKANRQEFIVPVK